MRPALQLPSSFGEVGLGDLDVLFAAWTTANLGAVHTCLAAQAAAGYHQALSSGGAFAATLVRGMLVDVRERAEKWNCCAHDGLIEG